MAFNYQKLKDSKATIDGYKTSLVKKLNEFSDLIERNVNNEDVWSGSSSARFKSSFDNWKDNNFKTYTDGFENQSAIVGKAIEEWLKSEN